MSKTKAIFQLVLFTIILFGINSICYFLPFKMDGFISFIKNTYLFIGLFFILSLFLLVMGMRSAHSKKGTSLLLTIVVGFFARFAIVIGIVVIGKFVLNIEHLAFYIPLIGIMLVYLLVETTLLVKYQKGLDK